jgi:hypothetical protein
MGSLARPGAIPIPALSAPRFARMPGQNDRHFLTIATSQVDFLFIDYTNQNISTKVITPPSFRSSEQIS